MDNAHCSEPTSSHIHIRKQTCLILFFSVVDLQSNKSKRVNIKTNDAEQATGTIPHDATPSFISPAMQPTRLSLAHEDVTPRISRIIEPSIKDEGNLYLIPSAPPASVPEWMSAALLNVRSIHYIYIYIHRLRQLTAHTNPDKPWPYTGCCVLRRRRARCRSQGARYRRAAEQA